MLSFYFILLVTRAIFTRLTFKKRKKFDVCVLLFCLILVFRFRPNIIVMVDYTSKINYLFVFGLIQSIFLQ